MIGLWRCLLHHPRGVGACSCRTTNPTADTDAHAYISTDGRTGTATPYPGLRIVPSVLCDVISVVAEFMVDVGK
jgi:hypothetical protein